MINIDTGLIKLNNWCNSTYLTFLYQMLIKRKMSVSITPIEVNANMKLRLSLEMTITSWRRVLPSTGTKPPEIAQKKNKTKQNKKKKKKKNNNHKACYLCMNMK